MPCAFNAFWQALTQLLINHTHVL